RTDPWPRPAAPAAPTTSCSNRSTPRSSCASRRGRSVAGEGAMGQPARILVVDDDADFCEALHDRLDALGFQVAVAQDGPAALRLVREEAPSVVVLDLVLPRMDGMAVLQAIRREEPDVVVVVITGHGTIARAVKAMKKGAYDFVPKPVDAKYLDRVNESRGH